MEIRMIGFLLVLLIFLSGCAVRGETNGNGSITLQNGEVVECPRGIGVECISLFSIGNKCLLTCRLKHGNAYFNLSDCGSVQLNNHK